MKLVNSVTTVQVCDATEVEISVDAVLNKKTNFNRRDQKKDNDRHDRR